MDAYRTLLADLCREVGIADAASLIRDGRLVIDGTEIALSRGLGGDAEYVWICVDFGEIPRSKTLSAYRAMLEANLVAGGLDTGLLSLHAGNGRAVLVTRRPLTTALSGESLAHALVEYVAMAESWRARVCGVRDAPGM